MNENINNIYSLIRKTLVKAREDSYSYVNFQMVNAYWHIGRIIVEEEQKGADRADYGKYLIKELSSMLNKEFGEGFNESNLRYMRQFYSTFRNRHALSDKLTWTHYRVLLRLDKESARRFYMIECIENRWSTRELDRQISSMLYERLALSKDKQEVINLSKKGQLISKPKDLIKDPYVLEFLGLKEQSSYSENELEERIISNLSKFLLELGNGFMFVDRQKRITLDNEHFYIDLVFYNRILKCFVLIELKMGKLTHKDLGQLQMYVNYYDREIRKKGECPTIGILLCTDKKELIVKYTLPSNNRQIFASKYRLVLPKEEDLRREIERCA